MGWFDNLFIGEAEQSRIRDVESRMNALNRRQREKGIITEQDERERLARNQATSLDSILANPEYSVSGGFESGLKQGADNIRGFVGGIGESVLGTTLRLIPWWLWAIAAAYGLVILWPYLPKPKR